MAFIDIFLSISPKSTTPISMKRIRHIHQQVKFGPNQDDKNPQLFLMKNQAKSIIIMNIIIIIIRSSSSSIAVVFIIVVVVSSPHGGAVNE